MEISKILLYLAPALIIALIFLLFSALRIFRISHIKKDYELDKFRHKIEMQIAELSDQLIMSRSRFEQLNHLLLSSQLKSPGETPEDRKLKPSAFLKEMGIDLNVKIEDDLILVLMPFNPAFDESFKVIREVAIEAGFRCLRGDEEKISKNILLHILQLIVKSRLVIANITGRNSNVFYELGISHAIGKQVVLIAETVEDMPFDVRDIRMLTYKSTNDLKDKLKNWLIHTFSRMS